MSPVSDVCKTTKKTHQSIAYIFFSTFELNQVYEVAMTITLSLLCEWCSKKYNVHALNVLCRSPFECSSWPSTRLSSRDPGKKFNGYTVSIIGRWRFDRCGCCRKPQYDWKCSLCGRCVDPLLWPESSVSPRQRRRTFEWSDLADAVESTERVDQLTHHRRRSAKTTFTAEVDDGNEQFTNTSQHTSEGLEYIRTPTGGSRNRNTNIRVSIQCQTTTTTIRRNGYCTALHFVTNDSTTACWQSHLGGNCGCRRKREGEREREREWYNYRCIKSGRHRIVSNIGCTSWTFEWSVVEFVGI